MQGMREILQDAYAGRLPLDAREVSDAFAALVQALEAGEVRAAEPLDDGSWRVNAWVKEGILVGFRIGRIVERSIDDEFRFFDKHNLPLQRLDGVGRSIRIVPGGTSVRCGAYLGENVIVMPPAYVNIGAYVGAGTLVD